MLNYSVKDAYRIIFGDKVTDTVRKKKRIVLIVGFICYLCHVMKVLYMFLFAL